MPRIEFEYCFAVRDYMLRRNSRHFRARSMRSAPVSQDNAVEDAGGAQVEGDRRADGAGGVPLEPSAPMSNAKAFPRRASIDTAVCPARPWMSFAQIGAPQSRRAVTVRAVVHRDGRDGLSGSPAEPENTPSSGSSPAAVARNCAAEIRPGVPVASV